MAKYLNNNIQFDPSTVNESNTDGYTIGTYHYADTSRLFELQRKNNFEIIVVGIDNLYHAGQNTDIKTDKYWQDGEDVLRLTTYSAPIPHFTQEPIRIKRGNNEIKYAGVPTFKEGNLKVYDTIGPDSKGLLMAWQNLSYDVSTEKVGLSKDYKKTAYLTEYTPDWQIVRRWKLVGCWISGISEEDADWSQGSYKTITATLQYDKAFLEDTDEELETVPTYTS